MKFLVRYKVGKHMRTKKIIAKNLAEAQKICDKKIKKWTDITMVNKTKGEETY